jgi:hypothetical protein
MLVCTTPVQDVGKLVEGSMPNLYFVVENTADIPFKIEPWTSCGCSTPTIPKNVIEAKEKMIVKLTFDSLGKAGINSKRFGLSYGTPEKKLVLKFIAEVIKDDKKV